MNAYSFPGYYTLGRLSLSILLVGLSLVVVGGLVNLVTKSVLGGADTVKMLDETQLS